MAAASSVNGRRKPPLDLRRSWSLLRSSCACSRPALLLWPTDDGFNDDAWQRAMNTGIQDHARGLHHELLTTSDARVAQEWLETRVRFAVQVPQLTDQLPPLNDIVLERAEVCRLDGRQACLLRYRVDAHTVSYYSYALFPEEGAGSSGDAVTFRQEERARYRVVAWEEAGLVHALVADLPAEKLVALAKACRARRNLG